MNTAVTHANPPGAHKLRRALLMTAGALAARKSPRHMTHCGVPGRACALKVAMLAVGRAERELIARLDKHRVDWIREVEKSWGILAEQ
jgi:hypothetical protein